MGVNLKKALITGITGQDGAYLAKLLLEKNYEVFGLYRRLSSPNFWRLQALGIFDKINLIPGDLIDSTSIMESIQIADPDEIYHLAAQSFVGASFDQPIATGLVTGLAVTRFLESIRQHNPEIKFYQASSSELYGNSSLEPQNEKTKFKPESPYAAAKLYGYWITKIARSAYNLFATNGILFNHESPLRGLEFVTRKISNGIAKIIMGEISSIRLGNIYAKRDWGYAPEYVDAMWRMLQLEEPNDFVIATNEAHSVKDFLEVGFDHVGLSWEDHVKIDKKLFRPLDVEYLQGDYTKAEETLGWKPKTRFSELVKIMVDADIIRWQRWRDGDRFPWDAPNYPTTDKWINRQKKINK